METNRYNIGRNVDEAIDLNQQGKKIYWQKRFACTENELYTAVNKALEIEGSSIAALVMKYLCKH